MNNEMGQSILTILTPTYNRANEIQHLYQSLKTQRDKAFSWIIIDDGSTDNTESVVKAIRQEADFRVEYYKKENGGKHTALNYGFEKVGSLLTFIVDSDDVLTPDAVASIKKLKNKIFDNNLAGAAFLRGYDTNHCIGDRFPKNLGILNDIDVRFRYKVKGDKAEVWRTDILKKYRFPVFDGEIFQGENYVWWQIALEYDMLYVNQIIYITEYLEGGLTRSGRIVRIKNFNGGMENSKMGLHNKFPLSARIKHGTLYNCYAFFARRSVKRRLQDNRDHSLLVLTTIPSGFIVYLLWKLKYKV